VSNFGNKTTCLFLLSIFKLCLKHFGINIQLLYSCHQPDQYTRNISSNDAIVTIAGNRGGEGYTGDKASLLRRKFKMFGTGVCCARLLKRTIDKISDTSVYNSLLVPRNGKFPN
jgi:hypothetical protein